MGAGPIVSVPADNPQAVLTAIHTQINSTWLDAAEAAIRKLATTGELFESEDVRELAPGRPVHDNHVGLLFSRMRRRGIIEKVEPVESRRREAAGSLNWTWRGTLAYREGRTHGGTAAER